MSDRFSGPVNDAVNQNVQGPDAVVTTIAPVDRTHVYLREMRATQDDSLFKIVSQIPAGATVLDVGTGSGALARQLARQSVCVVDGITYNEQEAALAGPHYRKLVLLDLELTPLKGHFAEGQYDVIVCADVLEHVRNAADVLRALAPLLKEGGSVLVSFPNVTHLGVLLGLMCGRFVRTREGLLDSTHVHFMDRTALHSLVVGAGYEVVHEDAVMRNLVDTEFSGLDFQVLPQTIRSYLLSLPDAEVYQFVWTLKPQPARTGQLETASLQLESQPVKPVVRQTPRFRTQLFLDRGNGYSETDSVEAFGMQSEGLQTLSYSIEGGEDLHSIRLDFSDRPGEMEFMSLVAFDAEGRIRWEWAGEWSSSQTYHQCDWTGVRGWLGGRVVRVTGADPWVRLELDPGQWRGVTRVDLCMSSPQPVGSSELPGVNAQQLREMWTQVLVGVSTLSEQLQADHIVREQFARARALADEHQITIDRLRDELLASRQLAEMRLSRINDMLSSRSWRITAGLRWLNRLFSRGTSR